MASTDVEDLDATRETLLAAGGTERDAPRQVAPEVAMCPLLSAQPDRVAIRVGENADPAGGGESETFRLVSSTKLSGEVVQAPLATGRLTGPDLEG